jgi:hypothetical protein
MTEIKYAPLEKQLSIVFHDISQAAIKENELGKSSKFTQLDCLANVLFIAVMLIADMRESNGEKSEGYGDDD